MTGQGSVDLGAVAALIEDVAAAEILPRFRRLEAGEIDTKASGEVVTVADRATEAALAEHLVAMLPGSVVVGEESAAEDPSLTGAIAAAPWVWIVDPVDGTRNFADGIEDFVTMVALVRAGETVAGWIYVPCTGDMVIAEAGGGAVRDGAPLAVTAARPLEELRGAMAANLFPKTEHAALARLQSALGGHRNRRCIGLDYVDMVSGAVDIAATGRLYPWDHAAGVLIHAEAGGVTMLADEIAYAPSLESGVMISAPDAMAWRAVRNAMYPDGRVPATV